jgi:hypothetical protein
MDDDRLLMDAFAEARRSWDELVGLQPDIYAGGGNLARLDLADFALRVEAHREAMDVLADALQIGSSEQIVSHDRHRPSLE